MVNKCYLVTKAAGENLKDPNWPDLTLQQIIDKAFDKYFIDKLDHAILLKLAGENLS